MFIVGIVVQPHESASAAIPLSAKGYPAHDENRVFSLASAPWLTCSCDQRVDPSKLDGVRVAASDHYPPDGMIGFLPFIGPFHRQPHLIGEDNKVAFLDAGIGSTYITEGALANNIVVFKQAHIVVPVAASGSMNDHVPGCEVANEWS